MHHAYLWYIKVTKYIMKTTWLYQNIQKQNFKTKEY